MGNLDWFRKGILLMGLLVVTGCTPPTPEVTLTVTPDLTATPVPANVVRLANGEWAPFMGEHLPYYGYWAHITTEAFALEGYTVQYEFYPWARALWTLEVGELEGSPGWAKTPQREQIVQFSEPLGTLCTVFFHRANYEFDWETETDLVGHRIGTMLGHEAYERLQALQQEGLSLNLDPANDQVTNFKKLLLDRVDLVPEVDLVGLYVLRQNFTPAEQAAVAYHPRTWGCQDNYFMISKQSPRAETLLQAFNRGLQRLKDSGRYDQMTQDFLNGMYDKPIE